MNKKILILVILSVLLGVFLLFKSNLSSSKISPNLQSGNVLIPTPTPTPTPPVFDKNSNLEEEIEKLTPEDFSDDFKTLKQEITRF